MSSGHYCDICHQNQQNCECKTTGIHNTMKGWSEAINRLYGTSYEDQTKRVFEAKATKQQAEVPKSDAYGIKFDPHTPNTLGKPHADAYYDKLLTNSEKIDLEISKKVNIKQAIDLIKKKVADKNQQPLKYGWNLISRFKPPSGKLQFYTIGGTCIYGEYATLAPGFATHWAYLLPSPTKQEGKLK